MNRKQGIAIVVGAVVAVLTLAFPPWYFPATTQPDGSKVEARFDAFRWRYSDREGDLGKRLMARALGRPISEPDWRTARRLVLGVLSLTAIAAFLLQTRSIFRCKRDGPRLGPPPSHSP